MWPVNCLFSCIVDVTLSGGMIPWLLYKTMIIICTLHCVYTAGVSACFEVLVSLWQLLYFATTSSPPFFQSSHDFIIAPQHCKQCPFPLIANLCGWSGSIKSLTVSPYNPPPTSIHSHPPWTSPSNNSANDSKRRTSTSSSKWRSSCSIATAFSGEGRHPFVAP